MYAESCDQSYSIGIKMSKRYGDLARKASCVWNKTYVWMEEGSWAKESPVPPFSLSGMCSYWLWRENQSHAPIWNLWVYMGILFFFCNVEDLSVKQRLLWLCCYWDGRIYVPHIITSIIYTNLERLFETPGFGLNSVQDSTWNLVWDLLPFHCCELIWNFNFKSIQGQQMPLHVYSRSFWDSLEVIVSWATKYQNDAAFKCVCIYHRVSVNC